MQRLLKAAHLTLLTLSLSGLGAPAAFSTTTSKTPVTKQSAKKATSTSSRRGAKSTKRTATRRDRGQKAPTPERITEIQRALVKDGAFVGTPNGKWDDSTVNAMRNFQVNHGLNASGKLDAKTLQQLGLGSQTAGVAPPTPPVKISSTSAPRNEALNSKQ
jgi:peptidoglycan hydrolase-like protein with peptidoglycan-binding domain